MASKRPITAVKQADRILQRRAFSNSTRCLVNPLLNLSHFSASKEAQFFSKERRIPRIEFSPYLELIRSSEVDIFAPAPGASPTVVAELKKAQSGQSDMNIAYSWAIKNLIQQLQISRKDAAQAYAELAKTHDKYKREERNSFLVMLSAVALFSLIAVKTNALQDLKEYTQQLRSEWRGFDWEWLGNPPAYKGGNSSFAATSSRQHIPPVVMPTPKGSPFTPIEAQIDSKVIQARSVPATQSAENTSPTTSPVTPSSKWTFSRLFWA